MAHRSEKDVHAYTLQVAGAALSALAPMIIKAGSGLSVDWGDAVDDHAAS
jgi:hypothetical protein